MTKLLCNSINVSSACEILTVCALHEREINLVSHAGKLVTTVWDIIDKRSSIDILHRERAWVNATWVLWFNTIIHTTTVICKLPRWGYSQQVFCICLVNMSNFTLGQKRCLILSWLWLVIANQWASKCSTHLCWRKLYVRTLNVRPFIYLVVINYEFSGLEALWERVLMHYGELSTFKMIVLSFIWLFKAACNWVSFVSRVELSHYLGMILTRAHLWHHAWCWQTWLAAWK